MVMPKREPIDPPVTIVHEMPSIEEISDVLQSYRDGGMTWREIAAESGVPDRILRKMHSCGSVIYRNARQFWNWHVSRAG
jgi:hypothetical protein